MFVTSNNEVTMEESWLIILLGVLVRNQSQAQRDDGHVKTEAEIGVMLLQAKKT
jgi:hypothetical protein